MRVRKVDQAESIIDRLKNKKLIWVVERQYQRGLDAPNVYKLIGEKGTFYMMEFESERDLDGFWELMSRNDTPEAEQQVRSYGGKVTPGVLDRNELPFLYKYGRFLFWCFNMDDKTARAIIVAIRKALL